MTQRTTFAAEPQRLLALARANEVRQARAELKRRIAEGDVSAAEVVRDAPWEAIGLPLAEVLMCQRHWGTVKCHRFLSRNHIGELKPIGNLTERQRRLLATQLELSAPDLSRESGSEAEPTLASRADRVRMR